MNLVLLPPSTSEDCREVKTMKTLKIGIMLLAFLLAAMVIVPMVSATDETNDSGLTTADIRSIDSIDQDIREYISSSIQKNTTQIEPDRFADTVSKKYDSQLDLIVNSTEKKTHKNLSKDERITLKSLIVREKMSTIYQEEYKKKLGILDSDFKKVLVTPSNITPIQENLAQINSIAAMPHTLRLVQVYPDVYGGFGYDSSGQYYDVNGGNQLYTVYWNHHPGSYTYYELHFIDEDQPDPIIDAAYDRLRANYSQKYPFEDIQSFIIWADNTIEFVDIWDSGNTYATSLGPHGHISRAFGSSTYVYISNVWNHAMDTSDRNTGMQKIYYTY